MKSTEEILVYLSDQLPHTELEVLNGDVGPGRIKVPSLAILDVTKILRDDDQLHFNTLMYPCKYAEGYDTNGYS